MNTSFQNVWHKFKSIFKDEDHSPKCYSLFYKKKSNLNIQYKIWKNNYGLRKGNFQNSITIKQVEF